METKFKIGDKVCISATKYPASVIRCRGEKEYMYLIEFDDGERGWYEEGELELDTDKGGNLSYDPKISCVEPLGDIKDIAKFDEAFAEYLRYKPTTDIKDECLKDDWSCEDKTLTDPVKPMSEETAEKGIKIASEGLEMPKINFITEEHINKYLGENEDNEAQEEANKPHFISKDELKDRLAKANKNGLLKMGDKITIDGELVGINRISGDDIEYDIRTDNGNLIAVPAEDIWSSKEHGVEVPLTIPKEELQEIVDKAKTELQEQSDRDYYRALRDKIATRFYFDYYSKVDENTPVDRVIETFKRYLGVADRIINLIRKYDHRYDF